MSSCKCIREIIRARDTIAFPFELCRGEPPMLPWNGSFFNKDLTPPMEIAFPLRDTSWSTKDTRPDVSGTIKGTLNRCNHKTTTLSGIINTRDTERPAYFIKIEGKDTIHQLQTNLCMKISRVQIRQSNDPSSKAFALREKGNAAQFLLTSAPNCQPDRYRSLCFETKSFCHRLCPLP